MTLLYNRMSQRLWLIVILFAASIRFFRLDFQSVWYDETISTNIARFDLWTIAEKTAQDTMPPLYYWLVHFAIGLWPNDFGARFVSAAAGVVCVVLVYSLGHHLFGERVATLAAFLSALAPFQIYYSQEARMYTLLGMLELAATLCFVLALVRRRMVYWAGFALFTALAFYTHNMAVLILAALIAYYLIWQLVRFRKQTSNAVAVLRFEQHRLFIGSLGLVTVLFLPWLAVLPAQLKMVGTSFWDTNFSIWKVLATFYLFMMNAVLSGWWQIGGLFLVLVLTVFALIAVVRFIKKGTQVEQLSLVLLLLLMPILLLALISMVKPLYLERVLIGSSYPFYILLGWWLVAAAPRPLAMITGSLLVALMVVGGFSWFFVADFAKPPMRDAAAYLSQNIVSGDVVLHTSDGSYQPFVWYTPNLPNFLAAGDPELQPGKTRFQASVRALEAKPVAVEDLASANERVWLIVALDHSVDWQVQQKRWFDENARLVTEQDFRGIDVTLYETGDRRK